MSNKIKDTIEEIFHSSSLVCTFVRSGLSAQVCGYIDFIVSFIMFAWLGFKPIYATAIGALVGGIFNAVINFKFTYKENESHWKAVSIKFSIVWLGSLILNSFGTEILYWLLNKWKWLETIGFKPDGYFSVARITVSALVSIFWNFILQKNFVYRRNTFDKTAMKIIDKILCCK